MESPRNMIFEVTESGDIHMAKMVGEPGSASHSVLYEYTYTKAQWKEITKTMDGALPATL